MKQWFAGAVAVALLLARPEAAANAAREALAQWYRVVAPALFPFMALMPLLTSDESLHFYERIFGGLMGLFGLPGAAASAVAVGLLAGSPAGCFAARRAAAGSGMNRGQLERLSAACCGLSPGFLISGVGAGMLGSAALGHILLRSQVAAQLILLALPAGREAGPIQVPPVAARDDSVGGAVRAVLGVAGYMALFAALAGALGALAGERIGNAALALMDVTSGARVVSAAALPMPAKLALLSGLTTFGGVCVCAQNLAALAGCGVRAAPFVARRAFAAAMAALLTWAQLRYPPRVFISAAPDPLKVACLAAVLMAIPAIYRLKKIYF